MTKPLRTNSKLGQELFGCRPRSLHGYSSLRFQGALPMFASLKWLDRVIGITSPIADSLILAGLPAICLIFVLQVILDLKPPHEPPWVRPLVFAVLTVSILVSVWWCWIAPRKDHLTVYERGFSWQVSLTRWDWFRSRGCVDLSDLSSFSYRSDCLTTEPLEPGQTTSEKLARILLELNLSRHDARIHLHNMQDIVIEKLFARFDADDLQRFIDHLTAVTEVHSIKV
jgi:hypothetical protein